MRDVGWQARLGHMRGMGAHLLQIIPCRDGDLGLMRVCNGASREIALRSPATFHRIGGIFSSGWIIPHLFFGLACSRATGMK